MFWESSFSHKPGVVPREDAYSLVSMGNSFLSSSPFSHAVASVFQGPGTQNVPVCCVSYRDEGSPALQPCTAWPQACSHLRMC